VANSDNGAQAQAQALGAIEGKLDMVIELVAEVRKDQKDVAGKAVELATQMRASSDHEKRIQELERDKSYAKGVTAVISALFGAISGWLFSLLPHNKG
jgi:hypothetical protein